MPEENFPRTNDETCPYCSEKLDSEDQKLFSKYGPLECPECGREGCSQCMPMGRDCMCPECEQVEAVAEREES